MSFPLNFPDIPVSKSRFGLNFNQAIFPGAFSRKISIHYHGGGRTDRWQGLITTPPLDPGNSRKIRAFVGALQGGFGTFTLSDPDHLQPSTYSIGAFLADVTSETADNSEVTADSGLFPGEGFVKGPAQQGHSLLTDGWPINATILHAGDRVQVASQYFVLVEDALTDASGEVSLQLEPAIRSSFEDNEPLILLNPRLEARLVNPVNLFTTGLNFLSPVTLTFEEIF